MASPASAFVASVVPAHFVAEDLPSCTRASVRSSAAGPLHSDGSHSILSSRTSTFFHYSCKSFGLSSHRFSTRLRFSSASHPIWVSPECSATTQTSKTGSGTLVDSEYVKVSNEDPDCTKFTVVGADRMGLLGDLIDVIESFEITVKKVSAKTEGTTVHDTFFLQKDGKKIGDSKLLTSLQVALSKSVASALNGDSTKLPPPKLFSDDDTLDGSSCRLEGVSILNDDQYNRSEIVIRCRDRDFILHDIVKLLRHLRLNVQAAEISNEDGRVIDKFYVTYRGARLSSAYREAVENAITAVLLCRDVVADDHL